MGILLMVAAACHAAQGRSVDLTKAGVGELLAEPKYDYTYAEVNGEFLRNSKGL